MSVKKQLEDFAQKVKADKKGSFLLFVPEKEMEAYAQFLKENLFPDRKSQLLGWIELDELKADPVRSLVAKMEIKATLDFKVLALRHFNLANKHVQNALLKPLEESRVGQVYILFASSEEGILKTILSRCQKYHFYPQEFEKSKSLRITNLSEWMHNKPKNREELRKLLTSWLESLKHKSPKDKLFMTVVLPAYLEAKKINVNIDLFWLNLYIRLKRLKQK